MRLMRCAVFILLCVIGLVPGAAAQQQPPPPTRAIVNVTGQLYRAQNNLHINQRNAQVTCREANYASRRG